MGIQGAPWGNPGTLGPKTHMNWDLGPNGPNGTQGPRTPGALYLKMNLLLPVVSQGPKGPNGTQGAMGSQKDAGLPLAQAHTPNIF